MVKHLLPVACLVLLAGCNPFEKTEKYTEKKTVKTQADGDDAPTPSDDSGSDADDEASDTEETTPTPPPTPRAAGDSSDSDE